MTTSHQCPAAFGRSCVALSVSSPPCSTYLFTSACNSLSAGQGQSFCTATTQHPNVLIKYFLNKEPLCKQTSKQLTTTRYFEV